MLFRRCVLPVALVVGLTSISGCVEAPPGINLHAYQFHTVGGMTTRIPLAQHRVEGSWQSDLGYNANAGTQGTGFNLRLDNAGRGHVGNVRSPARWLFVLIAVCVDNQFLVDINALPGQVDTILLPCERIRGIPIFPIAPGDANAQAMPPSFLISSDGVEVVDVTYGMPEIYFFDQWGNLASVVTASSLTTDEQGIVSITGSMPALTQNGTYYLAVSQRDSDSALDVVGTSTMVVWNGQDPPVYDPPPDEDPCGPDLCLY